MAGGLGLRLHPITQKVPKPLVKVGSKPILEQIIESYAAQGFTDFTLCVNYKAELIAEYFGRGQGLGVSISYVREAEPLGTAGALRFLPPMKEPFIVTNADVLTKLNANHLLGFHRDNGFVATVCTALYQHQVPYGVVDSEDARYTGMPEKPIENFAVNAGIYVLSPDMPKMISGRIDMPDVIERTKRKGSVGVYPRDGGWFDCGSFVDLARANQEWAA